MKSISQIRRSSFPSHFCKTENCLRSSKFEIPWQSFTRAPTAVALFSSTRPPGFNPYMGREERRVQGLDYKQQCVTLFFLYVNILMTTFLTIFRRFSKCCWAFPEHLRTFSEDCRSRPTKTWRYFHRALLKYCWRDKRKMSSKIISSRAMIHYFYQLGTTRCTPTSIQLEKF